MAGYLIVIEKAGRNFSAYAPDLPGCVATGSTVEQVRERMHEAIALHLEGLLEDGLPIPEPGARHAHISARPRPLRGSRRANRPAPGRRIG